MNSYRETSPGGKFCVSPCSKVHSPNALDNILEPARQEKKRTVQRGDDGAAFAGDGAAFAGDGLNVSGLAAAMVRCNRTTDMTWEAFLRSCDDTEVAYRSTCERTKSDTVKFNKNIHYDRKLLKNLKSNDYHYRYDGRGFEANQLLSTGIGLCAAFWKDGFCEMGGHCHRFHPATRDRTSAATIQKRSDRVLQPRLPPLPHQPLQIPYPSHPKTFFNLRARNQKKLFPKSSLKQLSRHQQNPRPLPLAFSSRCFS